MVELLKVNYDEEQPTVSARDLHDALGIKERFSLWFSRYADCFEENTDFTSVGKTTPVNNGAKIVLTDYSITVDMAKHISMMTKTGKGKLIRQYFIDLEKAWNTLEQIFARALKMADKTIESLKSDNAMLLEANQRMRPKEIFADAVATSETSILIGELAKIIKQNGISMGQNKLFSWMRENGYLIKRKGSDYNMPTQKSMEMGLFEIKETSITKPDGSTHITKTTKVTGKGQQYFINKFLKNNKKRTHLS